MRSLRYLAVGLLLMVSVVPLGTASGPEGPAEPRAIDRVVLGELFTATWCGFCPASDNAFDTILKDASYYPNRFVAIEWHPTSDAYGTNETDAVVSYYNGGSYPTAIFDGVLVRIGGSSSANDPAVTAAYKTLIGTRPATSAFTLEVSAKVINDQYTSVTVNVTESSSNTNSSLKAKAVIVEDLQEVHNSGMLRWTARDVIVNSDLSIATGETKSFKGTGTLGSGWARQDLGVVAYVQSDATKEVLQSTITTTFENEVNLPPTINQQVIDFSMDEDGTDTRIDLNAAFGDPEGDTLTYGVFDAQKVNVTLSAGKATLKPLKDWSGTEKLRFSAWDPYHQASSNMFVNVTVNPVNDAPAVKKQIGDLSVQEGSTRLGPDLDDIFGDSDSPLTFSVTGNDKIGVAINPTSHVVTLTAPDLWTGKEVMTFTAGDGQYTASVTSTVTALHVNHPPIATRMHDITMDEDGAPVTVDLKEVFSDADGFGTLAIEASDHEGRLTVTVDGDSVAAIAPLPNWYGSEVVVFTASDGIADAVTASATVVINSVNDAPERYGTLEGLTTNEEEEYSTSKSLKNMFRDADQDPLTYTCDHDQTKVSVDVNDDGTVTLLPVRDFFGKAPLVFRARDPGGLEAVYYTNLTVLNVNDPPAIRTAVPTNARDVKMNEGESQAFNINATDADGDQLTYIWSLDGKEQEGETAEFEYTSTFTSAGTRRLTVVVSDGPERAEYTWTIKVTDVNRPPAVVIASPAASEVFKNGAIIHFKATGTDLDGDRLTYKWTSDGGEIGIAAEFSATLRAGTHLLRVEVTDGKETASAELTVTVKKAPAPAPTPGFEALVLVAGLLVGAALFRRKLA